MRKTLAIAVATLAAFALAGCSSSPAEPEPAKTVTAAPSPTEAPEAAAPTADPFTTLVVEMAWGQATEKDKDELCMGIDLFGPEGAADMMRDGTADDQSTEDVDWDLAVELMDQKCEAR